MSFIYNHRLPYQRSCDVHIHKSSATLKTFFSTSRQQEETTPTDLLQSATVAVDVT